MNSDVEELDNIISKIKFSALDKITFISSAHGLLPKDNHTYYSIRTMSIKFK